MKDRTPSVTAGTIAAHRAIHSRRPANERICYDPFAAQFLTPKMKVLGQSWLPDGMALWIYERIVPGFHTYFAIRTRYLDDYLALCMKNGLEQLVMLGAGYDSRAYRFEALKTQARVFEVDHPATQNSKVAVLKKNFGSLPPHVVYVPIDFSKQTLEARLIESGYSNSLKTLFIWEGVTYYLTAPAIDETLAFVVSNAKPGSSIIFDYTSPAVVAGNSELREAKTWRRAVAGFGEPLLFGIEADAIEPFLRKRGFRDVTNANRDLFRQLYFSANPKSTYLTTVFNIVHATI